MLHNYKEAESYLFTHIPTSQNKKFSGEFGLKRMAEFLRRLDNPQDKFASIHIVGTSGKGSTAHLTAHILAAAGLKIGLHTSPHLQTVRERIQIDGQLITQEEFLAVINDLQPVIETMLDSEYGSPSYFEVLVAATFMFFAQQDVDAAVIEAGLGGKFDATNVLNSTISVVTNIGLDHTHILGNTKAAILKDKMQVINSNNSATVTGIKQPELLKILAHHCQTQQVKLLTEGKDFSTINGYLKASSLQFSYINGEKKLNHLTLNTMGSFQVSNAGLAITASLEFAKATGIQITTDQIATGLATTPFWGRFEIINHEPLTILDGAHNGDKIIALTEAIKTAYPHQKFNIVFGLKKNKDAQKILKHLEPIAQQLIITQFSKATDMGLNLNYPAKALYELAKKTVNTPCKLEINSETAITYAIELANDTQGAVLVTGSLYLVGELRENLVGAV